MQSVRAPPAVVGRPPRVRFFLGEALFPWWDRFAQTQRGCANLAQTCAYLAHTKAWKRAAALGHFIFPTSTMADDGGVQVKCCGARVVGKCYDGLNKDGVTMEGKTYRPAMPGSDVVLKGGTHVCRAPACMKAGGHEPPSRAKPKEAAAAAPAAAKPAPKAPSKAAAARAARDARKAAAAAAQAEGKKKGVSGFGQDDGIGLLQTDELLGFALVDEIQAGVRGKEYNDSMLDPMFLVRGKFGSNYAEDRALDMPDTCWVCADDMLHSCLTAYEDFKGPDDESDEELEADYDEELKDSGEELRAHGAKLKQRMEAYAAHVAATIPRLVASIDDSIEQYIASAEAGRPRTVAEAVLGGMERALSEGGGKGSGSGKSGRGGGKGGRGRGRGGASASVAGTSAAGAAAAGAAAQSSPRKRAATGAGASPRKSPRHD